MYTSNKIGNEMNDLESLATNFLHNKVWELCPKAIYDFSPVTTIVLFRDYEFQIEQIIAPYGDYNIGRHMHPDIDTIEIPFFGIPDTVMPTMRINNKRPKPEWLDHQTIFIRVDHGIYHGDKSCIAKSGVTFFSIQHWLNGVKPTSIGLNWIGNYVSEKHRSANVSS